MTRVRTGFSIVCLIWLCFVANAQAPFPDDQIPEIATSISTEEILIGDVFTYTITVTHSEAVSVVVLHQEIAQSDFFLRDISIETPTFTDDGRTVQNYTLELSTYDTGEFEIPPITVRYQLKENPSTSGEAQTPAIPIQIQSLTSEEMENPSIRDIKPQESVDGVSWLGVVLAIAALLLLILGLIAWLVYRMLKPKPLPPIPPRPAHEIALEALEALRRDRELILNHNVDAVSVRVSEITRAYIQARFGFPAPDYTTEEIHAAMKSMGESTEIIAPLQSLFERCDLVKFARHDLAQEEMLHLIDQAEAWIHLTMISAERNPQSAGEPVTP